MPTLKLSREHRQVNIDKREYITELEDAGSSIRGMVRERGERTLGYKSVRERTYTQSGMDFILWRTQSVSLGARAKEEHTDAAHSARHTRTTFRIQSLNKHFCFSIFKIQIFTDRDYLKRELCCRERERERVLLGAIQPAAV